MDTYLYLASKERELEVTPFGMTMPFYRNYGYCNQIYPIINSLGDTVSFHLRSTGYYEMSYNIYFKEEVQIDV